MNRQLVTLASVAAVIGCAIWVWHLNGGPNWYGVLAIALMLGKTIVGWRTDDNEGVSPDEQAKIDELNLVVAVPAYNEDPELLSRTLGSILDQTRLPQSVVVVDDASKDPAAIDEAERWVGRFAEAGVTLDIVRFAKNQGKRHGLIATLDAHPEADVMLSLDSDSLLTPDAIAEGIAPLVDPEVMVSTGMVLPLNHDANALTRLMDVRYASAFLFERAAHSRLGSVLCASGTIAFYRTSMVRKYRDDFLSQTFMGKPATIGDDRRMTNYALLEGKSVFRPKSVVFSAVPERLSHYFRQQVRWNRSYFRESWWALRNQPTGRPAFWLTLLDLSTWALFTSGLVYALFINPFVTGQLLLVPYLLYMCALGYAWSIRYFEVTGLRKSKRDVLVAFVLSPVYTLMHFCVVFWLRPYALLTIGFSGWGTRKDVEVTLRPADAARASVAAPAV
jgi:hyaluronan synthase